MPEQARYIPVYLVFPLWVAADIAGSYGSYSCAP